MGDGKRRFRDLAAFISRSLKFLFPDEILENQMMRPLYEYFGRSDLMPPRRWREAFSRDPDGAVTALHWMVRVEFERDEEKIAFLKREKQAWADKMNAALPARGDSFEELYTIEVETAIGTLFGGVKATPIMRRLNLAKWLNAPDMSHDEYAGFFTPARMRDIAFLDVMSRLHAGGRRYFPTRVWTTSDLNDMWMLAAYLPYCDVLATDKFWVDFDRRPGVELGARYGCQIVSATAGGIGELNRFLMDLAT